MKAEAAEEVHRPVLAEQVAAADFEERARRHLELLTDGAAQFLAADRTQAALQPSAETDRRRRGLLDRDEDIAGGFVTVP